MVVADKTKKIIVESPWSGESLDEVPISTNEEVEREIKKMKRSFKANGLSLRERIEIAKKFGNYLEKNAQEYARLVAMETGMPISHVEARLKIAYDKWKGVEDYLRNVFGDEYEKILSEEWTLVETSKNGRHYVRKLPKGVYLFLPANTDPMGTIHHLLDFILANNRVVVKPGTRAPLSTIMAVEDMKKFGLEDYITYVIGSGEEILDTALNSNYLDGVFFIGRSEHGRKIQARCAEKGIHYMGDYEGNNFMFILNDVCSDDKKLELAVSDFTSLSTFFNGLACTAIKACSPEENYERFKEYLMHQAEIINEHIGDPTERSTLLGPLISPKLVDECLYSVEDALRRNGKIIIGGKPIRNPNTGKYNIMPYTILEDIGEGAYILYTETPGPVVWIERDFKKMKRRGVKNEERWKDERLGRNGLRYIIATEDEERMREFAKRYRTAFITKRATDVDPIWMWGGSGKTSTFGGAEFLIKECMDTQTLYDTDDFLELLYGWHEVMRKNK
ncbi:MAG: aldehyde dehydrogenase family protein [Candidatus Aenigmatarchaeota archaeon]